MEKFINKEFVSRHMDYLETLDKINIILLKGILKNKLGCLYKLITDVYILDNTEIQIAFIEGTVIREPFDTKIDDIIADCRSVIEEDIMPDMVNVYLE